MTTDITDIVPFSLSHSGGATPTQPQRLSIGFGRNTHYSYKGGTLRAR
jgi:hypothetical protein